MFVCLSVGIQITSKRLNRSGPTFVWDLAWAQGRFVDAQNYEKLYSKAFDFCEITKNLDLRALRALLLFQLFILALSVRIFSLYSIKTNKKFADFIIFRAFSKFYRNKKLLTAIPLPWGPVRFHTKYGPGRFSRFDFYWIQIDRQAK